MQEARGAKGHEEEQEIRVSVSETTRRYEQDGLYASFRKWYDYSVDKRADEQHGEYWEDYKVSRFLKWYDNCVDKRAEERYQNLLVDDFFTTLNFVC